MSPEAQAATVVPDISSRSSLSTWLLGLGPLVLLGVLLAFILLGGPTGLLQDTGAPPVERLAITNVSLAPGRIDVSVLNDGPDAVTIAQVTVDDAFWMFNAQPGTTVGHLGRTVISIPYPWVHGEAHLVKLMTSTGVTFERAIDVAIETPRASPRVFGVFTLIGIYVGVVPVALGLMWFPLMKRMGTRGLQFLMALTVGLLAYLFVDASHDGLESAAQVPGSLQGPALFVFGAAAAYLALDVVGAWLGRRRAQVRAADGRTSGWVLAMLIAIGIGLHNFGEGLAIGSAFALGELTLGTLLIVGFALHNTTEGLAIVAPLARSGESAVGIRELVKLGVVGGVPTIAGAWLGALISSPVLAVLFLALGVGGIAQVTRQILLHSAGERGLAAYFRESHVVAGLAAGVLVMYITGLVVG